MPSRLMTLSRASLTLVLVGVSVAVAGWLGPASVHIVGWRGDQAVTVALLGSFWRLTVFTGLAVIVVVGVTRRLGPVDTQRLAQTLCPLTLLALWAVPYLPVLPSRVPLLLVLAGPARWVVAAMAVAGVGFTAFGRGLGQRWVAGSRLTQWIVPRSVFALSVMVFGAIGFHVTGSIGLGGDEPHYLVITHSVVADGDLRIQNNHEREDYRGFHEGFIPPHYLARGQDGDVYSIHAPGLPVLLVPAYLLAGHRGAVAFMVLIASLTATAVFMVARRLTTPWVGLSTWAAVCLTVPFLLQSWMIFPEMLAAAASALAAWWLCRPVTTRMAHWVGRGAVLGLLPWLHVKFSVLLAGLTVSLLITLWPRGRLMTAFLGPLVASGVAWLALFWVIYGTPDPTAPYGGGAGLAVTNVPRGMLGLLLDQEYGLLLYSPVYGLAGYGAWLMLRRPPTRGVALALVGTTGAFLASVTPFYMWWGGHSVPARFLVPVLPLMAPMVAVAFGRLSTRGVSGLGGLLLVMSLGAAAALVIQPGRRLMFNTRDGTGSLVEAWQGGLELTAALPSFVDSNWLGQLWPVGVWAVAGLAAVATALASRRWGVWGPSPFWQGVAPLLALGGTGGVLVEVAGLTGSHAAIAREGQQALLRAYDGEHTTPYSLRRLSRLSPPQLWEQATMRWEMDREPSLDEGLIAGPFRLPPGRYHVTVWFRDPAHGPRRVYLRYHRGPVAIADGVAMGAGPAVLTVDVPLALDAVWVGAYQASTATAARIVEIRPTHVEPRRRRHATADITYVRKLDTPGQFLFFLDDETFQERRRWWIRGDGETNLLAAPRGARRMKIRIRRSAVGGVTSVRVGQVVRRFEMPDRQSREVTIDLSGDETIVPVAVACNGGYRPADIDPQTTDRRYLGCAVSVSFL